MSTYSFHVEKEIMFYSLSLSISTSKYKVVFKKQVQGSFFCVFFRDPYPSSLY